MMRLAYVDPQSYHGLAKYDVGYLKGILAAGFDGQIRFYCSTLTDQALPEGIEARALFDYNRKRSAAGKLLSYAFALLRLLAEATYRRADVYHFQWFKVPALDLLVVLVLRKVIGARVVFTAHNAVPHARRERRHVCLGRLYRSVDAIVVHAADTAGEISQRFSVHPSRFAVQPHGPITLEPRGEPRYRKEIDDFVSAHDFRCVFLGRGARYKGLDVLLDAWPRVVHAAPGRRSGLIVVGAVDKDLKAYAQRTARQQTSVLLIDEHVPEADLLHAARAADVVVLPHRHISQSGALMSVLGLRAPVLVSSLPGLLEPLAVARVGWSFDGSAEGLAERLAFLAAHPEAVAQVRADGSAWRAIETVYDWTSIAGRGVELYQRLLAR